MPHAIRLALVRTVDLEPCARIGDDVVLVGRARGPGVRHGDEAVVDQWIQMASLEVIPTSDAEIHHDFLQTARHVTELQYLPLLIRQFDQRLDLCNDQVNRIAASLVNDQPRVRCSTPTSDRVGLADVPLLTEIHDVNID